MGLGGGICVFLLYTLMRCVGNLMFLRFNLLLLLPLLVRTIARPDAEASDLGRKAADQPKCSQRRYAQLSNMHAGVQKSPP